MYTDYTYHIVNTMAHRKIMMNEPDHEKTCLWGLDQVRLKSACSATEAIQCLGILDLASVGIIVSRQRTTKMHRLICTFVVRICQRFSHDEAHVSTIKVK